MIFLEYVIYSCEINTEITVGDLLYILGPFWGITEGHESTVGQDGEHDQHAEHRRNQVKEHNIMIIMYVQISYMT